MKCRSGFPLSRNILIAATVWGAALSVLQAGQDQLKFPQVELAFPVSFPKEKTTINKRGLSTYSITNSVTHPGGHVVDLLYDAGEGAQIREPLSGRIVWVSKSKLGNPVEPEPEAAGNGNPFTPYSTKSVRPIRFPLLHEDGRTIGNTTLPVGQDLQVTAEKYGSLRVETRNLSGWVSKTSLEQATDRPVTASATPLRVGKSGASGSARSTLKDPPAPAAVPFTTSNSHAYVERVPLTITAEILGLQKYPMPGQKGGFWSTEVKPIDLALAWGPFLQSGTISARMGYRSAQFSFNDPLANIFSGNFHMTVDDPEIRKDLLALRVGDVVRLRGALIRLEHPRGKADPGETTITGAFCYSMLCREVEKVKTNMVSGN
jgi:hypothetical protein